MDAPLPNQVFTEETFKEYFGTDLAEAVMSIEIESAYASVDGIKRFAHLFVDRVQHGVRTCVFIQEPTDWSRRDDITLDPAKRAEFQKLQAALTYMQSLGIHASLRKRTHLKIAVIDNRITWGGSLNVLSYTMQTEEEIYRWQDESWARDTVKRRRFRECPFCRAKSDAAEPQTLPLGRQIALARKNCGKTQEQLAESIGIARETLSRIETGKLRVRSDTLERIHRTLGNQLVVVPDKMVEDVIRWVNFNT